MVLAALPFPRALSPSLQLTWVVPRVQAHPSACSVLRSRCTVHGAGPRQVTRGLPLQKGVQTWLALEPEAAPPLPQVHAQTRHCCLPESGWGGHVGQIDPSQALKLQLGAAEFQGMVSVAAAVPVCRGVSESWAVEAGVVAPIRAAISLAEVQVTGRGCKGKSQPKRLFRT